MDIREAIEFLKMLTKYFTFWENAEKLKAAVETVEKYYTETEKLKVKEIPVKPETLFDNGCINAFCPTCKSGLGLFRTSKGGRNHCPWCGQAIDWEKEDEQKKE